MLQDDTGAISVMRVITFLTALSVIIPKIVLAIKAGVAPAWDAQDMEMLGVVLGAKLVQNQQEKETPTVLSTPPTTPAPTP